MSKNYRPTTEQVCGAYVCDAQPTDRTDEELRSEFYGWLDRVVSKGWIEGYKAKENEDNQSSM